MNSELENIIDYLKKERLISVSDMVEKLGLESRHDIYNIRRTATIGRKKALYKKITEVYKDELLEYKYEVPDDTDNADEDDEAEIRMKYTKLLEKQNELLKRERDLLEASLLEKIRLLEEKLKDIKH